MKILKTITDMKRMIFLFTAIASLLFSACSDEYDSDSALYFKTVSVVPSEAALRSSPSEEMKGDTIIALVYTGKDIKWFNGTTGELRFKDYVNQSMIEYLNVFLDEEFLFSLWCVPNVMSYVVNYPVLTYEEGGIYYISKGYPRWDWLPKDNPDQIEREENWKAMIEQPGWNKFIKQLRKEGRYRRSAHRLTEFNNPPPHTLFPVYV